MTAVRLSYCSLIARDLDRLADFYRDAFGLEEILASRSERYREFEAGGAKIGVLHFGGYAMLDLPPRPEDGPVGAILTLDVGTPEAVAARAEAAAALGARLVKAPYDTFFGQRQALLLDPEGNAVRVSAPSPPGPSGGADGKL